MRGNTIQFPSSQYFSNDDDINDEYSNSSSVDEHKTTQYLPGGDTLNDNPNAIWKEIPRAPINNNNGSSVHNDYSYPPHQPQRIQRIDAPTPDFNNTDNHTNINHYKRKRGVPTSSGVNLVGDNVTIDNDKTKLIYNLPRKNKKQKIGKETSSHWLRRELMVYMAKVSTPIYQFVETLCASIGPSVDPDQFIKVFPHEIDSLSRRTPVSEGGIPHINYGFKDFIVELASQFTENPNKIMIILRDIVGNFHKSRRFVRVVGTEEIKKLLKEMDRKMKADNLIERLKRALPKEEEENIVKLAFLPGKAHVFVNLTQDSKDKVLEITQDTGKTINKLVKKLEEIADDNKITNEELNELLSDNDDLKNLLIMYKRAFEKLKLGVINIPVKRETGTITIQSSLIHQQLNDFRTGSAGFNINGRNDGRAPIFLPTARQGRGGRREELESDKYDELVNWRRALDEIFRADRTSMALGEEEAGRNLGYLMLSPHIRGLINVGTTRINSFGKDFKEHELMYSVQIQAYFTYYLAQLYPGVSGNSSNGGMVNAGNNMSGGGGGYNVFIKPGKTRYQISNANKEQQAAVIFWKRVVRNGRGDLIIREETHSRVYSQQKGRNLILNPSLPFRSNRHFEDLTPREQIQFEQFKREKADYHSNMNRMMLLLKHQHERQHKNRHFNIPFSPTTISSPPSITFSGHIL